ncbi:Aldehyde/histidinol dehydrogenase [Mucidula mucida]|nr:Aldehyde/histidinol dehydrogenase [Mucidula mucida]
MGYKLSDSQLLQLQWLICLLAHQRCRPTCKIWRLFEVVNPVSKGLVGTAAAASIEDCTDAIEAAARAFQTWQFSTTAKRRAIFEKACALLQTAEYEKKMIAALQDEVGANPHAAAFNWRITVAFASAALAALGQLTTELSPRLSIPQLTLASALSCCPWNLPGGLSVLTTFYPIIFGNTVVLKPSEYAPRSQAFVLDVLQAAGLPNGVLNLIPMSRDSSPQLIPHIIAHCSIRKVVFVGSGRVGRIVAMEAAKHLKPCFLELGGKVPAIVLDDVVDVNKVAKDIVSGSFWQSGQACIATERVIVQRGVSEALLASICRMAKDFKFIDPLISAGAVSNFLGMVEEAKNAGAEVLLSDFKGEGLVVRAHIMKDVRPGMRLWDEELFGPVDTVEEAIEMANASDHSLMAAIWTADADVAKKVATRLRSTYVNINGSTVFCEPTHPIASAGSGASGFGEFNVREFTYKQITVTHSN